MYIRRKLLCLYLILALVQTVSIFGQTDECTEQTTLEDISSDSKQNETYKDEANVETGLIESVETVAGSEAEAVPSNATSINITKVNCLTDKVYGPVEIVNATRLMELLILEPNPLNRTRNEKEGKQTPGTCILILFYARWCTFSSQAAPHFNALPRSFPHIKAVAIDAIKYQNFNAQYGIVGVPTLILVHNGKPVAKFNATVYALDWFANFIISVTTLRPIGTLYVDLTEDFNGPVPSTPSNETDYCLVLSWIFIAACALYFTSQSRWWQQFVELVQNTWRESNAQHEHVD